MTEILLYAAGVITGAGLMFWHYKAVEKAVAKYQRRIQDLETERRTADCADAYRRGKNHGEVK